MDAVDSLTAPIALYPDALIAQILVAATNVKELQSFSEWMGTNGNLKGSELQSAAEQAGFGAVLHSACPIPAGRPDDGPETGLDNAVGPGFHE